MPKDQAVLMILGIPTLLLILTVFMFILGWKKPESYYKPWLRGIIRHYVMILLCFITVDTIWYNVYYEHQMIFINLIMFCLALTLALSAYLTYIVVKRYLRVKVSIPP